MYTDNALPRSIYKMWRNPVNQVGRECVDRVPEKRRSLPSAITGKSYVACSFNSPQPFNQGTFVLSVAMYGEFNFQTLAEFPDTGTPSGTLYTPTVVMPR